MERTDLHTAQKASAPDPRDESTAQAYEPPSVTELGSFLELTGGGATAGTDVDSVSQAQ
jgi:hypothetical protein